MSHCQALLKLALNIVDLCIACFEDCEREGFKMPYFAKVFHKGGGKTETAYGAVKERPQPKHIASAFFSENALACGAQTMTEGHKTRAVYIKANKDVLAISYTHKDGGWRYDSTKAVLLDFEPKRITN